MKKMPALSMIMGAVVLAACASNPTPPPELVSARAVVQTAQSDPKVLSSAPLELKKATDALDRAERLNAKGESLSTIASAAYVAERNAQTALAVATAKANEDAIKGAETERERARADAREADARRAQAQAAAARADASNARLQASDARQQADAAQMSAAQAQMTAAQAQQANAALQQQLSELQAKQTDRGMLVTLGDVLFEFGLADIRPGAQGALNKLASYLQQHPERRVLVEGYTDSVGTDAANMLLSQRRAEAVAAALASLGVTPDRISTKGYGKGYPVADNNSDTNRAMNRRVEVYISDTDQPVRARG